MTRVLVVEDEESFSDALSFMLRREGYEVGVAADGSSAIEEFDRNGADLVLLDLMLPGIPGTEVCRTLRQRSAVPIIMLTAKDGEVDKVVGLELGADDYVVKPYSVRELAARIRAISRRRRVDAPLASGRVVIDRAARRVTVDGEPVDLTTKEFDLLAVLAEEPGRVVPRQELFSRVWDPVWVGTGKTLDVHVGSLRKKLGDASLVETVRGVGYRLSTDPA